MNKDRNIYDKLLLNNVKAGDTSAFTIIFTMYYHDLVQFAKTFTKQTEISEEIVQDVFVTLWENCEVITIQTSLKSYLLRMVQNSCIDWLRHLKVRGKYAEIIQDQLILIENDTENYVLCSELERDFAIALDQIPEDISKTYRMNRLEGMKQMEIAEELGVSLRTVELRLSKALTLLREKLKDYLIPIILFSYLFF